MGEEETDTASCSTAPELPNRQDFERSLSDYNDRINDITEEIDNLLKECHSEDLKTEKNVLREKREKIKKDLESRKPVSAELKDAINVKENQIMEMENDLIYKKEDKLLLRLQDLEKAYNQGKFTSIREEQVLVKEMDRLKRNLTRLTKYKSAIEEKHNLSMQFSEEKRQQKILFKDIRALSEKLNRIHQKMESCKRRIAELKLTLKNLFESRKILIEKYNTRRAEYAAWLKSRKKQTNGPNFTSTPQDHSYPATFPTARQGQQSGRCFDEEEQLLEPFYEYKVACRRLIAYLESLQTQMEDFDRDTFNMNPVPPERQKPLVDDDDDSAEEYPANFITLKKHTSLPANPHNSHQSQKPLGVIPTLKKRASKRSAKKPNQPIKHQLEFVRLFADVEVDLPVCYQQVGHALDEVVGRLESCKEQTNIIMWEESDYQHMTVPSDSGVESNWNGSADMSEISSIGGYSLPISPLPNCLIHPLGQSSSTLPTYNEDCNEVADTLTSLHMKDEGIDSKNSTH